MSTETVLGDARRPRHAARKAQVSEAVMAEGTIRISLMAVHRDLDQLETRGGPTNAAKT